MAMWLALILGAVRVGSASNCDDVAGTCLENVIALVQLSADMLAASEPLSAEDESASEPLADADTAECLPEAHWVDEDQLNSWFSSQWVSKLKDTGELTQRKHPQKHNSTQYSLKKWQNWIHESRVHIYFSKEQIHSLMDKQILVAESNPNCSEDQYFQFAKKFLPWSAMWDVVPGVEEIRSLVDDGAVLTRADPGNKTKTLYLMSDAQSIAHVARRVARQHERQARAHHPGRAIGANQPQSKANVIREAAEALAKEASKASLLPKPAADKDDKQEVAEAVAKEVGKPSLVPKPAADKDDKQAKVVWEIAEAIAKEASKASLVPKPAADKDDKQAPVHLDSKSDGDAAPVDSILTMIGNFLAALGRIFG